MGVALVVGAWNYPFSVTIQPAIAAIAAGNCVMLKPSELAPHSSNTMKKLFDKYMDSSKSFIIKDFIKLLKEKFK